MKTAAMVGVLLMAHGGDAVWNRVVEAAAAPLRSKYPTAVAYGMAQADTLQKAVTELEKKGVRRVVVVRLFLDSRSFLMRTQRILGLVQGAAPRPKVWDLSADPHMMHHGGGAGGAMHMDPDAMPIWRVESESTFVLDMKGLLESGLGPPIMAKRVKALSKDPRRESVLLLAHGVGDEEADQRWRIAMLPAVEAVKNLGQFRSVAALTLRDDWPDAHARAVAEIKAFVRGAKADRGRALVVPYRLYGFGPQAESLAGLDVVTDEKGLLPDPAVGKWLVSEADRLINEAAW